jgi:hypothetical protein
MTQLQLFPQSPAPPERKKQLEQAIRETRLAVDNALKVIDAYLNAPDDPHTSATTDTFLAAVRSIDTQVDNLETLFNLLNADNEELKMVAGKLRFQRDEAIKARAQVLVYLRQRKGKR